MFTVLIHILLRLLVLLMRSHLALQSGQGSVGSGCVLLYFLLRQLVGQGSSEVQLIFFVRRVLVKLRLSGLGDGK